MVSEREVEWASAVGSMVAALWVPRLRQNDRFLVALWVPRLRQNYRFLVALWTSRVVKLSSVWSV
jgi:hypothetical protein